jgi:hypothetical protein
VLNSIGLGGIIGYLFKNEHERRNLITDVLYLKGELKEVKLANRQLEKNYIVMEKDLQHIVSKVDEILLILRK